LLTAAWVTPIRQVELTELRDMDVPADATRCMLVLRWRGRVVGASLCPARNGIVSIDTIADTVRRSARADTLDTWIDDLIGFDERQTYQATTPAVSVAVCTRERPDDLARALDAIRRLEPAPLEVLVIDNAPSSDATRGVVERAGVARYVRESRPGLNVARNRALREARGDIVAFTDDDAVPEPDWIAGLLPNFADPCVMVACGITLPLELATDGQELFEKHCTFIRGFRRRLLDGQIDSPFAVGPAGAGANMAVRKDTVIRLGGFDERLDGGTPTRSGGDHELFVRVLLQGHRIVYDPAAVSWHRHRRSKQELFDTVYGYGLGVYAMWTGLLVERGEVGVLRLAWQWLRHSQLRNLVRRDGDARRVARRELAGCARGPHAWFLSRRQRSRGQAT
jgi:glycosyltransferase involved in cell wall biosynthesis